MKFIIDTNVISETVRKTPDLNVMRWLRDVPSHELYLSVLTIGEIRRGIEKLEDLNKKEKLLLWLDHDFFKWFGNRILPINLEVAEKWGYLTAYTPLSAIDSLIAATALSHNLKIVTRNTKDFCIPGLEIINPWNYTN